MRDAVFVVVLVVFFSVCVGLVRVTDRIVGPIDVDHEAVGDEELAPAASAVSSRSAA